MPQPRVPAGDERRGRIHPGEFSAEEAKPKARGRRTGAVLPPSAPVIANGAGGGGGGKGQSGKEREALAKEHESRLPEEMGGAFRCVNCGWAGWREHPVVTREGKMHATLAFQGCSRCGTMHVSHVGVAGKHGPQHTTARQEAAKPSKREPARGGLATRGRSSAGALAKTIDTGETALLGQDLEGPESLEYVGHRKACPRGGESPCGKAVDGKCGICDVAVQDHEALTKTQSTLLDLRKLAGLA